MKAVVFAYHNMGIAGLDALKRHGFIIQAIFTHKDDPGENCWFASVESWAKGEGIPVFTPGNINTDEWIDKITNLKPDIIFSFYYRNLISQRILDIPRAGAFNLHGSFLPAFRGRVPVNWVLICGEQRTGVTLHYMVKKADAGDIVGQRAVDIDFMDTAFTLYGKLCTAASLLLDELLPLINADKTPRHPQDESSATTFGGRRPEDGKINWHWSAIRVYNMIRAVAYPYPGAFSLLPDGKKMIIWWGIPVASGCGGEEAGLITTIERSVYVTAGEGAIELLDVDISGNKYKNEEIYEYFKSKEGIRLT
ncbi:MAG: formyltransferase [Syntrophales bacterium]|nr:formyltransferase [Syntrophales bacterium]